jgi:hypothetical protein
MAVPGALDQSDPGSEGDDFSDEEATSDDFGDDVAVVTSESTVPASAPFEPPPPSALEEPVEVAHSEVEETPPASEVTSTQEPVASNELPDPLPRGQS